MKLTVVSKSGKEATIGIVGEGSFFREGSLAGQLRRMGSAAALSACELLRIDKKAMIAALHREHAFSDLFVAYLLMRNIRYEEDLVDQLFNSSEKRLARVLLMLARFGKEGVPETVVPKISQETLAEMNRHHAFAGQLFYEPLPQTGFHSLQRRPASPQLAAQCGSARLALQSCNTHFQRSIGLTREDSRSFHAASVAVPI